MASMKKERIRKATSTNGVMSVAVLFLGILTLGMNKNFVLRFNWFQKSIIPVLVIYIKKQKIVLM